MAVCKQDIVVKNVRATSTARLGHATFQILNDKPFYETVDIDVHCVERPFVAGDWVEENDCLALNTTHNWGTRNVVGYMLDDSGNIVYPHEFINFSSNVFKVTISKDAKPFGGCVILITKSRNSQINTV